ncbi:hypothetical protein [Amycolatopsis sp. NPDC059657]|uniref:hypothetical protein n=1 Tax=Amycolatopsis sp. NPDC059657 TaxID=3346899 RepID=UPI00366C9C04
MMRALHMRAGAARAAAEHAGVEPTGKIPFLENEIETVENAVRTLDRLGCGTGLWTVNRHVLLTQLQERLGYAYAVEHLGGTLPVIRKQGAWLGYLDRGRLSAPENCRQVLRCLK